MSVTCYISGRWGNAIFSLAQMIAYAKKYDLSYFVPLEADAYKGFTGDNINPLQLNSTGEKPTDPLEYIEPNQSFGNPSFHEIPEMGNIKFIGYWQSFKYFDWCRNHILEIFNFPYHMEKGMVSISVRRGDCLQAPHAFPVAPTEYYHNAIEYMHGRGYNKFLVHSDDQNWCKEEFITENYPNAIFQFSDGGEAEDFLSIQNCEHNICARSTFSLTAAWFNKNTDKIVLVPQEKGWWKGQNLDLIPDYFTQIKFNDADNPL